MKCFNVFVLERAYALSVEEQQQINNIVSDYKELFFKDMKTRVKISQLTPVVYFKDKMDGDEDNLYLGNIEYEDLQDKDLKNVNVFVNFSKDADSKGEYYKDHSEIYLYYYNLETNERIIRDILTHELLHAKQQYKTISAKYRDAVRKRVTRAGDTTMRSVRRYFYDPIELPVYTTLILKDIISNYNQSDKFEKKILKDYIKSFIMRGARLDEDDTLAPVFLKDKSEFLKYIFKNRKHKDYKKNYQNFIKKLYWVYGKMK